MAAFSVNNIFKKTCIVIVGVTLFSMLMSFQEVEAAGRPLRIQPWLKENRLIIQSLPKGSETTPSPNPCTYIPGTTKGRCTLAENETNSGAHLHARVPPPASPEAMVQFPAASKENGLDDHSKKDQSSS